MLLIDGDTIKMVPPAPPPPGASLCPSTVEGASWPFARITQYTTQGSCEAADPTPGVWTAGTYHRATISERYFLTGFDSNVGAGGTVKNFTGYTNTERTSKTATNTSQAMFDQFETYLDQYLGEWEFALAKEVDNLSKNQDPLLSASDKLTTEADKTYITAYLVQTRLGDILTIDQTYVGVNSVDGDTLLANEIAIPIADWNALVAPAPAIGEAFTIINSAQGNDGTYIISTLGVTTGTNYKVVGAVSASFTPETAGANPDVHFMGIDQLNTNITARQSFIPTRKTAASDAKEIYYANRINYTIIRADLQSGTLSRLNFIDRLQGFFPLGGTPNQKSHINRLKKILEDG